MIPNWNLTLKEFDYGIHNVLVGHEMINGIEKKTKGSIGEFAFKAYMSKAYDRMNWDFLRNTLTVFG